MYNIPPLDLHIKEIGLTTFMRLKHTLNKPWRPNKTFYMPHLAYWEDQAKQLAETTRGEENMDICDHTIRQRKYRVDLHSMEGGTKHLIKSQTTIYTDGSKTKQGVGSGFVVYYKNQLIHSDHTTCLLYTSPSPRDKRQSRMPSSA